MGIENPVHLLFIAVVALVVLGPRRLPELARSLGKGIREFRAAMSDGSATGPSHAPSPPNVPVAPEDAVVVAPSPEAAPAPQVDPPEPVRSGDHAPDSRPL